MTSKRAIVDIGSNTVRLVIYGGPPRAPAVLHNEKVTAKLGRGVNENGLLSRKGMQAALSSLARYRILIEAADIDSLEVVATAAVRDAANGRQFLEAVSALGFAPRLLSGEEEAITSAHGVIAAFPGAKGIVADLGGGSLELIDIDGDSCAHGISLPLGTLNLPQLRKSGPAQFLRKVAKLLQSADLGAGQAQPLYLVGGSCRAFARYAMQATGWPLDDPHGFELDTQTAIELAGTLIRRRSKLPLHVPSLSASRLGSLPDASALLAVLAQAIQPSRLIFSSWGLREGLIYRALEPAVRKQDPMLTGIAAFASDCGCPASLAARIADWTACAGPPRSPRRESLRRAAIMLSISSLEVEPNLRSEHALDWALRKRWIGIDDEGKAMLAAAVLANTGRAMPELDLERLASTGSLQEAAIWGQAIRLCRRLTGCMEMALTGSRLDSRDKQLVLCVSPGLEALFTDTISKDLRVLAKLLGMEPEFSIDPESDEKGPEIPNPFKAALSAL